MKASDLDFLLLAFSTISRILETVDSPNSFVVCIFRTPERLMQPLRISSPTMTSRGMLSPVSADVLSEDVPSTTIPSIGTLSPGLTTIVVPISTSSGSTSTSSPSCSMKAESGRISMSLEILVLLISTATDWNSSPI